MKIKPKYRNQNDVFTEILLFLFFFFNNRRKVRNLIERRSYIIRITIINQPEQKKTVIKVNPLLVITERYSIYWFWKKTIDFSMVYKNYLLSFI